MTRKTVSDIEKDFSGDGLFTPSVTANDELKPPEDAKPWALHSQIWVALLAGVAPITIISFINMQRLGIRGTKLRQTVILGVIALLLLIAVTMFLPEYIPDLESKSFRSYIRLSNRVLAMVLLLIFNRWQKVPDQLYSFKFGNYSSFWVPALVAIFILNPVQNTLIKSAVIPLSELLLLAPPPY